MPYYLVVYPQRLFVTQTLVSKPMLQWGLTENKMLVIENGFDLSQFYPDEDSRESVRHELGLPGNGYLIGMAARYNPQKDHANFIRAASLLLQKRQDVDFLLWGNKVDDNNLELAELVHSLDLQNHVHMLGLRMDGQRLFSALDIATLSSAYGEAFPQVIGEAMACGVPCVVTDVGDSAILVGDTGRVVPPRDYVALAKAWAELLDIPESERILLGSQARQRIIDHYCLKRMAESYSQLYRDIIADINSR